MFSLCDTVNFRGVIFKIGSGTERRGWEGPPVDLSSCNRHLSREVTRFEDMSDVAARAGAAGISHINFA